MSNGTVKFFNETKGFGFIKVSGSNQEVFVHVSELKDQIRQDGRSYFRYPRWKKRFERR